MECKSGLLLIFLILEVECEWHLTIFVLVAPREEARFVCNKNHSIYVAHNYDFTFITYSGILQSPIAGTQLRACDGYMSYLLTPKFRILYNMIHELLLALSGHPSPLLTSPVDLNPESAIKDALSPSENALLATLANDLGEKHAVIRKNATEISAQHPSVICRAIAASILSNQLRKFQKRILDVEKDILDKNSNIVSAYDVVPLSAVVGAFDGWSRKLEWLHNIIQSIQSPSSHERQSQNPCTGVQLIERLRAATHTGYDDIEGMALDLTEVAERAWLQHLSAWLLYGRLLPSGAYDFFVAAQNARGPDTRQTGAFVIESHLIPTFVNQPTADSILFIGKSLNHIREKGARAGANSTESGLQSDHLAFISSLQSPINISKLSAVVIGIRTSLSRHALQKLLPMPKILEILSVLRDYFLLERGEFATALISAADQRLVLTQQCQSDRAISKETALANVIIKEAEVSTILSRAFSTLLSFQGLDDEAADDKLDIARDLVRLSIGSLGSEPGKDAPNGQAHLRIAAPGFDDILLPISTTLSLRIVSPLDLFLTPWEIQTYSRIHAYLLSIRRAQTHLSNLSLLFVLRRDGSSPRPKPGSQRHDSSGGLTQSGVRVAQRAKSLRLVWTAVGSALIILSELGEYFQGEVVKRSWIAFYTWLDLDFKLGDGTGSRPTSSSSNKVVNPELRARPSHEPDNPQPDPKIMHDPQTMTEAHRAYLSALVHSLLLDDMRFTTTLRKLMTSVDYIAALMQRMSTIRQNANLQGGGAPNKAFDNNNIAEEEDVENDLRNAQNKLANDVQALIDALREIDATQAKVGSYGKIRDIGNDIKFAPWVASGVDRLLLKLDFAKPPD